MLEDEQSLARRAESGFPVSVQVKDDGPSTDVYLAARLPGGRVITAEVDAGSDQLILNQALAATAGADLTRPDVRKVEGQDETGHAFARYFTALRRPRRRPVPAELHRYLRPPQVPNDLRPAAGRPLTPPSGSMIESGRAERVPG